MAGKSAESIGSGSWGAEVGLLIYISVRPQCIGSWSYCTLTHHSRSTIRYYQADTYYAGRCIETLLGILDAEASPLCDPPLASFLSIRSPSAGNESIRSHA